MLREGEKSGTQWHRSYKRGMVKYFVLNESKRILGIFFTYVKTLKGFP